MGLALVQMKNILETPMSLLNTAKKRKGSDRTNQVALLIWDVFRGQETKSVLMVLRKSIIVTGDIPDNMTNHYQPLDCATNN